MLGMPGWLSGLQSTAAVGDTHQPPFLDQRLLLLLLFLVLSVAVSHHLYRYGIMYTYNISTLYVWYCEAITTAVIGLDTRHYDPLLMFPLLLCTTISSLLCSKYCCTATAVDAHPYYSSITSTWYMTPQGGERRATHPTSLPSSPPSLSLPLSQSQPTQPAAPAVMTTISYYITKYFVQETTCMIRRYILCVGRP